MWNAVFSAPSCPPEVLRDAATSTPLLRSDCYGNVNVVTGANPNPLETVRLTGDASQQGSSSSFALYIWFLKTFFVVQACLGITGKHGWSQIHSNCPSRVSQMLRVHRHDID